MEPSENIMRRKEKYCHAPVGEGKERIGIGFNLAELRSRCMEMEYENKQIIELEFRVK